MAIIRPSSIVGAISGSIGGTNFATGKNGPYVRSRVSRTKSLTPKQSFVRVRFQFLRHEWQGLTDAQRTAWRMAAANRPHINRLGLTSHLSGHALFIQHNQHGWPDTGTEAIDFDETPPTLAAAAPMTLQPFSVTGGGTKEMDFILPPLFATDRQSFYGARTSSSNPRRSWTEFKFLTRQDTFPKPPLVTIDFTTEWDERIGDPKSGEVCFAAWFTSGISQWPSVTQQGSTVAV